MVDWMVEMKGEKRADMWVCWYSVCSWVEWRVDMMDDCWADGKVTLTVDLMVCWRSVAKSVAMKAAWRAVCLVCHWAGPTAVNWVCWLKAQK